MPFSSQNSRRPHQKFLCCRMHTALALYRLDHDGDGVFGAGVLECLQIVVRRIGEAVGHRAEADLAAIARLAGRGHGTEGAAVEAHLCGDDMVLVRTVLLDTVFTGHLDHGLVGLGAGILEEDLVHADGRRRPSPPAAPAEWCTDS